MQMVVCRAELTHPRISDTYACDRAWHKLTRASADRATKRAARNIERGQLYDGRCGDIEFASLRFILSRMFPLEISRRILITNGGADGADPRKKLRARSPSTKFYFKVTPRKCYDFNRIAPHEFPSNATLLLKKKGGRKKEKRAPQPRWRWRCRWRRWTRRFRLGERTTDTESKKNKLPQAGKYRAHFLSRAGAR